MTLVRRQTATEALADALKGLDHRMVIPLDELPAVRIQWADTLIARLRARGFDVVEATTPGRWVPDNEACCAPAAEINRVRSQGGKIHMGLGARCEDNVVPDIRALTALDALDGALDAEHPEGHGCAVCRAADELREALQPDVAPSGVGGNE